MRGFDALFLSGWLDWLRPRRAAAPPTHQWNFEMPCHLEGLAEFNRQLEARPHRGGGITVGRRRANHSATEG